MNQKDFLDYLSTMTEWDDFAINMMHACGSSWKERLENLESLRQKVESMGLTVEFLDSRLKHKVDEQKERQLLEDAPLFYEGKRFLHNVMGDYLIKAYGACKINDSLHVYDHGVYKKGEEALQGYMIKLLPELTAAKRKEVIQYINVNMETPNKKLSPPNLIPFATRIYDIKTRTFLEYSPEYVFLNRFPYDYIPDAPDNPLVIDTIRQIADGNDEVIELIYEAIGNCFQFVNSYRGAIMLYGPSGNNGKSTLLHLITCLLGEENVSFLSLQDTAERFRLAEIYGKVANIGDDIPSTYLPDSSIFKSLVTGGKLTAEKKGKDPFDFCSYAKMFFAMNALPPVSDKSKAFFSRVLLVPLNRDFSSSDVRDVSLKDRDWTKEEMECLTRLSVEALHRLIERGDFVKPKCVLDAVAEYEEENNPILQFLEEYGSVIGKPTQLVYDHFGTWCEANGHKNKVTRYKFSREIERVTGCVTKNARHTFFAGKSGVGKCFMAI